MSMANVVSSVTLPPDLASYTPYQRPPKLKAEVQRPGDLIMMVMYTFYPPGKTTQYELHIHYKMNENKIGVGLDHISVYPIGTRDRQNVKEGQVPDTVYQDAQEEAEIALKTPVPDYKTQEEYNAMQASKAEETAETNAEERKKEGAAVSRDQQFIRDLQALAVRDDRDTFIEQQCTTSLSDDQNTITAPTIRETDTSEIANEIYTWYSELSKTKREKFRKATYALINRSGSDAAGSASGSGQYVVPIWNQYPHYVSPSAHQNVGVEVALISMNILIMFLVFICCFFGVFVVGFVGGWYVPEFVARKTIY